MFRRPPVWSLAVAVVAVAAVAAPAGESPVGKVVGQIVPVNNRVHPSDIILGQVRQMRVGKPYDEAAAAEDVRALLNTRWFAPGGVKVDTKVQADGRVTVFLYVVELNNVVSEVVFVGAQHLSESELFDLTQVRRGSPLNPASNQLAAQTIQNKLRDDGRAYATVTLMEGGKLSDTRVVFQIVEGPVVRVRGVEFYGNQVASGGRLRTQVNTTGPLIPGVVTALTAKYTPEMVANDKQKLMDYYHRLGHLDVRVREEVVPHHNDISEVTLVYHIDEGRPYDIGEVRIDGAKVYTEDRLRTVTEIRSGKRYDREVIQRDVTRLRDYYGNRGLRAGVEEGVFAVPGQPGVVNVHYKVYEPTRPEPDRVGRIIINGNDVTADRVILNQLGLRPGQVLQYSQLEIARQNLMRIGLFDVQEEPPTVNVRQADTDTNFKDIEIRVKETRTGSANFQVAVNSDAGLNGSLVLNQRNFDVTRFPTSWDDIWGGKAFRGGGQEFRLEASPGTQFQRYAASLREPFLFDSRFGGTLSAYYFTRDFVEYDEGRVGLRATVDYRFDDRQIWRTSFSTRIESVDVSHVPYWASRAITDDFGQSTVLGLRLGATRDTRDSYLLPTKGSVLDFGVEQVLGDYQFPIGTIEASTYHTLFERKDGSGKQILAARTQLSVAGQNAPVFERFYGGGFRSLRGFSFRGVGPNENNLNVGGTFAFLNTVEYQIPLMASDKVYLVGFCDHGTIENSVKIADYRVTVGFGLRLVVPALGPLPIALDFAFPVKKSQFDDRQMFSFYVGWFGGQ